MKIPARDNFTSEVLGKEDPYNPVFSKTDNSIMSNAIKNGSLDFGDLKSGGSGFVSSSPGLESEKAKKTSPRSPVGRTNKQKLEK